jgi:hypothetical protein
MLYSNSNYSVPDITGEYEATIDSNKVTVSVKKLSGGTNLFNLTCGRETLELLLRPIVSNYYLAQVQGESGGQTLYFLFPVIIDNNRVSALSLADASSSGQRNIQRKRLDIIQKNNISARDNALLQADEGSLVSFFREAISSADLYSPMLVGSKIATRAQYTTTDSRSYGGNSKLQMLREYAMRITSANGQKILNVAWPISFGMLTYQSAEFIDSRENSNGYEVVTRIYYLNILKRMHYLELAFQYDHDGRETGIEISDYSDIIGPVKLSPRRLLNQIS